MNAFVAVTDSNWFRYLRSRSPLDEVNFWQPGGSRRFRTLQPGEPFLFKLHSPENFIVGGGFFAHASLLPASLAWEAFGDKNGAATFEEMRQRIGKYRRTSFSLRDDPKIGSIILVQPFFLDEIDWIPVPPDFSLNIVQGKTYDSASGEGLALWSRIEALLQIRGGHILAEEQAQMFGKPTLVHPRLGQGAFRILITDTYERRCAATGERALPVLEAAHIRSVATGGVHRVDNGLLMRSDLHRLYDRGYVTVRPDRRIEVSRRLKDDFDNGEPYYALHGRPIWLPASKELQPRREFLEWHADTVFRT